MRKKKARGSTSFPLSFAQQRLWFLHQMDAGAPVYNVPLAARLTGPLDVEAVRKSLNGVLRRHDVLRTTFAAGDDGAPVQIVAPSATLAMPVIDLSDTPGEEQASRVGEVAVEE